MALRTQIAKLSAVGATAAFAALALLAGPASAQSTSGVTVSPNPVQTAAVFSPAGTHPYSGDAGVITVTIAANSTFKAGTPLKFEECNLDPTAQTDCDGLTIQTTDVGSTQPVKPNADGSVTLTMDLWELPTGNTPDAADPTNNNPSGFDPNSTVLCDDSDPCSIWVGDDPSNWSSNSFVANSITPIAAPATLPTTTTTTVATTTTTAPTTTTTIPTTTTTGATTSTTAATTSTTAATTSTTAATTSTTVATTVPSTTTTTTPGNGQVPESPYVSLLPVAAIGLAGGGFVAYRIRRRRPTHS